MSAACHQTTSPTKAKNIQIRRVVLNDASQMPSDLSSTPGGTLFSTTPGGMIARDFFVFMHTDMQVHDRLEASRSV